MQQCLSNKMLQINIKNSRLSYCFLHFLNIISCYLVSWKDVNITYFLYDSFNIVFSLSRTINDIEVYYFLSTFISTFFTIILISSISNSFFRKLFLCLFFFFELIVVCGTLQFGTQSPMMLRSVI